MNRRQLLWTAAAGALLATAGAAAVTGVRGQRRALTALHDRLERAASQTAGAAAAASTGARADALGSAPPPVARYLRLALGDAPAMTMARIRQTGVLRTDPLRDRWMPFDAEHLAAPHVPAFVWNARVKIAPLLHVRVRDAFIDGSGSGQVSLQSAFTVASDGGSPEMNAGALHRFLAEAVWWPAALLPRDALRWTAIDPTRALATLTAGDVSVSLEFRFGDTGEVTGIYTPARWGSFQGRYEQRAWEGHFRNYDRRGGLLVPDEGDVGWYVDDEWHAVWKGRVVEYSFE